MSHLRLAKVAAIAVPLAFLLACSSSRSSGHDSSSSSHDVGGAGGLSVEVGTSSSASAMEQGGSAGSMDAAPSCVGNPKKWDDLTSIPGACEIDTDCCVIMSPCHSQAQVVAEAQMEEAIHAWPYCSEECNDCVPPAIEVACIGGQCRGRLLLEVKPSSPLRTNHCGSNLMIVPLVGTTDTHFACN